jgi:miniconductance mechanosensitive channel
MNDISKWIERIIMDIGVSQNSAIYLRLLVLLICLSVISMLVFWIMRHIVIRSLYRLFKNSPLKWDDTLSDHRVLDNLAHLAPAILVRSCIGLIFSDFETMLPIAFKLTDSYLIIAGMLVVFTFLRAVEYTLSQSALFVEKPLASYFQLLRIILYIATGILVLSVLLGKSPVYFLSAFGAMTAILLLIFKDTILGLVASVQISANDMVRVGDWVEMPKFNADGDVLAINLNTVKVRNWDKTVTTIPTYYFITDSFKNWRGMKETGGRRIKRAIYVNIHSIRFVDPNIREKYKSYYLINDYINERQKEIEEFNAKHNFDTTVLINGRRMTNIGVFRRYIQSYLENHPGIRKDMTLLVRQLSMEDRGVPIEIYCFTNTTAWAEYENIQADIFDHLLAAVEYFGLEIFQQPGGSDLRGWRDERSEK